jgi:hypothetical protein
MSNALPCACLAFCSFRLQTEAALGDRCSSTLLRLGNCLPILDEGCLVGSDIGFVRY